METQADLAEQRRAELASLGLGVDRGGPEELVLREVPALLAQADRLYSVGDLDAALVQYRAAANAGTDRDGPPLAASRSRTTCTTLRTNQSFSRRKCLFAHTNRYTRMMLLTRKLS